MCVVKPLISILNTLSNIVVAYASHPGKDASSLYRAIRKFKKLQEISKSSLRDSLSYSLEKGYVRLKKRGNITRAELTDSGKKRLEKEEINSIPPKQKVWDKKWRIVIFDIPELHKSSRDGFAKSLKLIGFTQIQKSVFAFPYPCQKELGVLVKFHDVEKYTTVIIAESIDDSGKLKKLYSL